MDSQNTETAAKTHTSKASLPAATPLHHETVQHPAPPPADACHGFGSGGCCEKGSGVAQMYDTSLPKATEYISAACKFLSSLVSLSTSVSTLIRVVSDMTAA
eukprot:TRINITY_DN3834_c0_g2_i1.p2 TRINITY_DN3834_c0_g2~~TRINITY_DN3834_c0_g2_i1.p2  ORF type:complete len:102 (-),score=1.84 TRINITY_DN3834_c0_g2_i1:165-470(-)